VNIISVINNVLTHLHSIGIVHRDIKPENFVYTDKSADATIQLTGFALAKMLKRNDSTMKTPCGSPMYAAPEILNGKKYGTACDMWGLGVVVYILMCGYPPFFHESTVMLYMLIKQGRYTYPADPWDKISDHCKSFIDGLLTIDPSKRMTSEGVMKHVWIRSLLAKDLDQSNLSFGSQCSEVPGTQVEDEKVDICGDESEHPLGPIPGVLTNVNRSKQPVDEKEDASEKDTQPPVFSDHDDEEDELMLDLKNPPDESTIAASQKRSISPPGSNNIALKENESVKGGEPVENSDEPVMSDEPVENIHKDGEIER